MNLTKTYSSLEEYLEACLKFFIKHQYLITVPNTHVLVENVLNNIDVTGLEDVDFYADDLNVAGLRDKSEFLNEFLTDLDKLIVEPDSDDSESLEDDDLEDLESRISAPMSVKKRYEVVKLAEAVESVCKEHECDTVVDLGSGLGYLDQHFHETTGLNVLGVECSASHLSRAQQRQARYYRRSRGAVVFVRHTVDQQSAKDIEGFLRNNFPSHGDVCITGLHACGDLTVDGIHIFLKMAAAKTLVLMPCCYHRMKKEGNRFKNFPLSSTLKQMFEKYRAYDLLQIPFLRLASHPARNDQSLPEMVFSLTARAVLQLHAFRNNYTLKKNKRKPIKKCVSFDSYVRQASTGYTLVSDDTEGEGSGSSGGSVAFDMDQLRSIWSNLHPSVFARAALYIQLQNWSQPVAEALILLDRVSRLRRGARARWAPLRPGAPRAVSIIAAKDT